MIRLSEILTPRTDALWRLVRQCGVTEITTLLDGAEQDQRMFASVGARSAGASDDDAADAPWSKRALTHLQAAYADYGLSVAVVEDTPPLDTVRLGLPGRDEQIERTIEQIRAMGELDMRVLCYNWMAVSSWCRTDIAVPTRGGALVTQFDRAAAEALPPLAAEGEITTEQLWDALRYFLAAVLPVAEEYGVRLALHPDDPPLGSIRGIPRIITSAAAYRALAREFPSEANAITFCQGNFALMNDDMPALIREFGGEGRIAFSHFRDVRGTVDHFEETFHDDGDNDMAACMLAYREAGFDGPMRADHVPTLFGEVNERPGYETLGRLFALGYIRGLIDER